MASEESTPTPKPVPPETPPSPPPTPSAPKGAEMLREIRIHPYDKILYFWPTVLTALICYLVQALAPTPMVYVNEDGRPVTEAGAPAWVEAKPTAEDSRPVAQRPIATPLDTTMGLIFLLVLLVNMTVLCFDFTRMMFLLYTISALALILLLALINLAAKDVVLEWLRLLQWRNVHCSDNFFLYVFLVGAFMLVAGYVKAHIIYWVIDEDKLHCTRGFMGDRTAYKTIALNVDLEIPDVLEYAFGFGAGTIRFEEPMTRERVLLRNVPRARGTYEKIRRLQREIRLGGN